MCNIMNDCAPKYLVNQFMLLKDSGYDLRGFKNLSTLSQRLILRVKNEQFSEEKGFILRYTEKEDLYSFRRDSNPRSMGCKVSDLPLS